MDEEGLEAAARSLVEEQRTREKEQREKSKRTSETSQGTWLGGAQRGSLWLCYAGPLVEERKSGIAGKRRRPRPIS